MSDSDVTALQEAIQERWPPQAHAHSPKVKKYVGKFWARTRMERRITAVVRGNHGDYTVSIEAQEGGLWSTCSCIRASWFGGIALICPCVAIIPKWEQHPK